MDINGETIEIIKKYYKYKDSKIGKAEFIKLVCNYFDTIKNDKNVNRYVLTAPTSFGKTFLVYEIIKKMDYKNIMLIFPTISLLSENYDKLSKNDEYIEIRKKYKIHTLSNVQELAERNIWIYTPERYMSYTDKNPNQKFDFAFIDEIYKIDNEFDMDEEVKENERDTAFRLALAYTCENSKDILLAGPYIEVCNQKGKDNFSFDNFIIENNFEIVNYNDYEIVNKEFVQIKNKSVYTIDNMIFNFENTTSKFDKMEIILNTIKSKNENVIIYCGTKAASERYAKEFLTRHNFINENNSENSNIKTYNIFLKHIQETKKL